MNSQQLSRLFVTVILFLACVVLALLAQAQGEIEPNKCHIEWDFCNSGSEAENAYHWQLGWCVAAVERGAVSASVSACMGQEEGTVSYPRTSSSSSSFSSSAPAAADDNKCYTEWDFCNSGSEAENAYHWKLGWYTAASERGEVSVSLDEFMGGEPPAASSLPEETAEPKNVCRKWWGKNCLRWSLTPYYWTATLPPEMMCFKRDDSWPFHCLNHIPAFAWVLDITATAQAGG